jgi:hypothetical protein
MTVATEGVRWVAGTADGEIARFVAGVRLPEIHAAQKGLMADLDAVANVLYGRR